MFMQSLCNKLNTNKSIDYLSNTSLNSYRPLETRSTCSIIFRNIYKIRDSRSLKLGHHALYFKNVKTFKPIYKNIEFLLYLIYLDTSSINLATGLYTRP